MLVLCSRTCRRIISAILICTFFRVAISGSQLKVNRFIRRKTEDDNTAGEAYFKADKMFLEDMVAKRKVELESKYTVYSLMYCFAFVN